MVYKVLGQFGGFGCVNNYYIRKAVKMREAVRFGGCGNIFRGTVDSLNGPDL